MKKTKYFTKPLLNSKKHQAGQAMITAVIFFLIISTTVVLGIASPILKQVRISNDLIYSKGSYFLAEGALEDIVYRFRNGKQVAASESLMLNDGSVSMTTTNVSTGKQIIATAILNNNVRKMQADIVLGTGISFHYGIQAGNGGFTLSNSSSITGNVYASGPIIGGGNMIYGDVISTGSTGLINGIHATGTAYAHTIQNSTIDRDAYYVVKTSTTVGGTSYPNSPDQGSADLPISDAQIAEWESDALAGGIMPSSACNSYSASTNTCTLSSNISLGPKKIPFNLLIKSSSGVLNVTGPLWVTGNITAQTGPTIKMDSSLGGQNVAIIADNPSNTTGSGIIDIGQSTTFQGSGTIGSFVFMISQNNSAETGGSTNAISMAQGASALVAYAAHGLIQLSQSVSVKESTAYKISLSQSANVTYDTGLPSVLFSSGPSGGYDIWDWKEVQ
jgi:Tfp pilus assembly protein PilX